MTAAADAIDGFHQGLADLGGELFEFAKRESAKVLRRVDAIEQTAQQEAPWWLNLAHKE
jgi:hypothetical protein